MLCIINKYDIYCEVLDLQQLPVKRCCIPDLLFRKGLIQRDLATHLEVTEQFISGVVNLRSNLSVLQMRKVSKFLNCTMEDLYEWNDD